MTSMKPRKGTSLPDGPGELEVLARVGKSLLGTIDLEEQLTQTLQLATAALGADRGSVMLVTSGKGILQVMASSGLPSSASGAKKEVGEGISGWVAVNREPVVVHGDVGDPRFAGIDPKIISSISLPLIAEEKVLGVLNLVRMKGERFSDGDLALASSLADMAALAIEKARLHEDLKERESRVSDLLGAAIGAQERERRRIAADIHDGFLQDLSAVFLKAENAKMLLARGKQEEAVRAINDIQEMVREEVMQVRNYIFEVRPPSLDNVGLGPTLNALVDRVSTDNAIQGEFVDNSGTERVSETLETILYRVAQEGLRNVVKHAKASGFVLSLDRSDTELTLMLADDGLGIDPEKATSTSTRHYGIETMRERVELAGGLFYIGPRGRRGTEVRAVLPISVA